jgi:hypothetical protein
VNSVTSALVAALAATAFACNSSTTPASPLEGAWVGNLPGQTVLSLHLTVSDSSVGGSAALASLTSITPVALTVSGRFVAPDVSLSLSGSVGTITFVGTLGTGGLVGSLNGGGYANTAITLSKH